MLKYALALTALFCAFSFGGALASEHGGHGGHGGAEARAPEAARAHTGTGIVENIDRSGNRLTLRHEPVPSLRWPAMSMRFEAGEAALPEDLRPGDKVRFDFLWQNNTAILTDIELLD